MDDYSHIKIYKVSIGPAGLHTNWWRVGLKSICIDLSTLLFDITPLILDGFQKLKYQKPSKYAFITSQKLTLCPIRIVLPSGTLYYNHFLCCFCGRSTRIDFRWLYSHSASYLHSSKVRDRIREMWEPRLRWTPEHSIQSKQPRFKEAHSGSAIKTQEGKAE